MRPRGVQNSNFPGIFISTWSQTVVWSCISRSLSSIRRASLIKRQACRWSRGEAGTAVGGEVGIRKPTEFVISRVMQDVWQLVRILTVLFSACLPPPWQVVICALERFHWLPPTPRWGLRSYISGLRQRETPKLLVLITQKDSSPDSGMWSPLGSQQAWAKMKACLSFPALNVLCTRQLCWWVSAFVLHRTTHMHVHTHTHVHKHCKPLMHLNTLPNTHRHTQLAAVTQTLSPQCAVKTFQNTQSCVSEMMKSGWHFRRALSRGFADGFSDHIKLWFWCAPYRCFPL